MSLRRWRTVAFIIALVAVALFLAGYLFDLPIVGFSDYIYTKADGNIEFQRGKTLWDWMQLLIVPVVLAIGGFIFNRTERQLEQQRAQERADLDQKHTEERAELEQQRAEERAHLEQQRAEETQREAALQTYLDQMAELLLRGLRSSKPDSELRDIARIRTVTTLRRLDRARCTIVFRFLHDANLVTNTPESIVNLKSADFSGQDLTRTYVGAVYLHDANLEGTRFWGAYLGGVNLERAYLARAGLLSANLVGANLERASLFEAKVGGADLRGANLGEANLIDANLVGAILIDANLIGALLSEAILDKANLERGTVTNKQLATCRSLRGATLPDGTTVPDNVENPFR